MPGGVVETDIGRSPEESCGSLNFCIFSASHFEGGMQESCTGQVAILWCGWSDSVGRNAKTGNTCSSPRLCSDERCAGDEVKELGRDGGGGGGGRFLCTHVISKERTDSKVKGVNHPV